MPEIPAMIEGPHETLSYMLNLVLSYSEYIVLCMITYHIGEGSQSHFRLRLANCRQ